jgi:hypothetical protein
MNDEFMKCSATHGMFFQCSARFHDKVIPCRLGRTRVLFLFLFFLEDSGSTTIPDPTPRLIDVAAMPWGPFITTARCTSPPM